MGTITSDQKVAPAGLGEELPVFCERCGYSLHGLPQARCEECTVLQFHCPECGHHQPINTLRPAAQRIIGRLRAVWLTGVVLFKLNFFGWLLFAFGALALESSYAIRYTTRTVTAPNGQVRQVPSERIPEPLAIRWEHLIAFGMFALPFGMVSRMLLLRWPRGWAVGLVVGGLVALAMVVGVKLRGLDFTPPRAAAIPAGFAGVIGYTYAMACLGALVAWPIWTGLVKAFLPSRTGAILLEWQSAQSSRPATSLARE